VTGITGSWAAGSTLRDLTVRDEHARLDEVEVEGHRVVSHRITHVALSPDDSVSLVRTIAKEHSQR
jgi:hypothetical protein